MKLICFFLLSIGLMAFSKGDVKSTGQTNKSTQTKQTNKSPNLSDEILCKDSCLLLTEYTFEEVASKIYCEKCKKYDEDACELDWPSSDVMACEEWDYMRNCVFARYGYPFQKSEWKEKFSKMSWYKENPKFSETLLSPVAKKNIQFLKKSAEQCRKNPTP